MYLNFEVKKIIDSTQRLCGKAFYVIKLGTSLCVNILNLKTIYYKFKKSNFNCFFDFSKNTLKI